MSMSKFANTVQELGGKKVRFYLGGGELGYVQGPVKKVEDDLIYIEKQSFCLDLRLIALSFWITFRGKWESRGRKI